MAPHFFQKLDYDPVRDFEPVAITVYQPVMLIVRPSLGVKSVAEFVAYAKNNPGKLSFGVQGLGSEMHLMLEADEEQRRHQQSTPSRTTPPRRRSSTCSPTGSTPCSWSSRRSSSHVDNGRLLALATLNAKRVASFPDAPTMTEAGLPAVTAAIWFGYLAPARTPRAMIDKLARRFAQLQSDAALVKRTADLGAELTIVGPAEFGRIIEQDRRRYGKIVADGNLAKLN